MSSHLGFEAEEFGPMVHPRHSPGKKVLAAGAAVMLVVGAQITATAAATGQTLECGDFNASGAITATDALSALQKAVGIQGVELWCPSSAFPASGQVASAGPGSDGDLRKGAPLRYVDNGDGTVTDLNTGLMWEKKSDDGSVHDRDNTYTWGQAQAPYTMNGTMVTDFLAALNTPPCFAGHCDWRIPNVRELYSIMSYRLDRTASAEPAFDSACAPGCTVTACSCTSPTDPLATPAGYWSSTTVTSAPASAWVVTFALLSGVNPTEGVSKDAARQVRAVRTVPLSPGPRAAACGDVDAGGSVAATDALIVLKKAVGLDVGVLACPARTFPATGQTISYGPGSDGDVRAGAPLAFIDNGDGTITDPNTGLMWERKSNDGSVHDRSLVYGWSNGWSGPGAWGFGGTIVTDFLATLNTPPCFAGHCDWRIPNARELESIIDYGRSDPALPPPFVKNCHSGCAVSACGCSPAGVLWSSTTAGGVSFSLRAGKSVPPPNALVDPTTMNAAAVANVAGAGTMDRWPKPLGSFVLAVRNVE